MTYPNAALIGIALALGGLSAMSESQGATTSNRHSSPGTVATVAASDRLIRIHTVYFVDSGSVPLLTVPVDALHPYTLVQTHTDRTTSIGWGSAARCAIHVGSTAVPLMIGSNNDIRIPFAPGESLSMTCENLGVSTPVNWLFVLSR